MTERYDAIVIGGGVAGATTAILLAQAGWSVAVVEKSEFPRRKVCGECVAATNLPLLDALGVGAEFAAQAGPALERVGLYCGERRLTAPLPRLRAPFAPWGRALGRDTLDALLLRRARDCGAALWQPWTAKHVARRAGLHECRVVHAATGDRAVLCAPVAIAAHGSWEPPPDETATPRHDARDDDLLAFKANFSNAAVQAGLLPVLAFAGGYGGMVLGDRGRLTLACCVRRDRLREWRRRAPGAAAGVAVQTALAHDCGGVRDALHGATREGPWLSVGPVRPGIRAAWTEPRGFAVGNAAGEAHPILGEGISMAMQAAWLLCGRLTGARKHVLAGADQAAIGAEYAHAWRRQFGARLRWAAVLAQIAMRPTPLALALPLLQALPPLLTLAARIGGKVAPPATTMHGSGPALAAARFAARANVADRTSRLTESDS